MLSSGTGPKRPLSVQETGGGPAATGSVVPFLEGALKKTFWPPINADERRLQDGKDVVLDRRLSAFISCFGLLSMISLSLAAQGVKSDAAPPEVTHTDIKRSPDGSWLRVQSGGGEAAPAARLQISSQARVVLRGSPGNRITFQFSQRVRGPRTVAEAARWLSGSASITTSPGLTVIAAQGLPFSATLELYVPALVRTASLEIPKGGDIEIYNFRGSVFANTPSGDIQADNIGGQIVANTGGGHIRLGRVDGPVQCYSGGGSITVADAGAEVNCQTVGGEIVVTHARGFVRLSSGGGNITVERAGQRVEAHSMQGEIRVGQAGGSVIADTRGGAIRVGSAAGVHAESAAGPVHVTDAAGSLNVSTAIGNILAELLAGGRLQNSSLSAASGDITVMIPSNVAVSVMATNENGGIPLIRSEFSEVLTKTLNFARPPLAEGAIHGGGPVLLLSGNGLIYLKKAK